MLKTDVTENTGTSIVTPDESSIDESLDSLLGNNEDSLRAADFFFVMISRKLIKIRHAEILSIQVSRCCCYINTKSGKRHQVVISLTQLAKKLPAGYFVQIHRAWMVPVDGISEVGNRGIIVHDKWFALSKAFRKRLLAQLAPLVFNGNLLTDLL